MKPEDLSLLEEQTPAGADSRSGLAQEGPDARMEMMEAAAGFDRELIAEL